MSELTLDTLSRDERNLLLYFESCAVDKSGRLNCKSMNENDVTIARRWAFTGFIEFGRICHEDCNDDRSMWVFLSDHAFELAHQERKARALRLWDKRSYRTTDELRMK